MYFMNSQYNGNVLYIMTVYTLDGQSIQWQGMVLYGQPVTEFPRSVKLTKLIQ